MQHSTTLQTASLERKLRFASYLSRYWIVWFALLYGIFVGLPILAPFLMKIGAEAPARTIYTIYSFLCHQLPERSYFLFGEKISYSVMEIQASWKTNNLMVYRQFIGTPELGWKMAWSDRMVSMYTSILLFVLIWWPLRRRIPKINWVGFILLALPMAIDGTTHMINDFSGMYGGFRFSNEWLAVLTNNTFLQSFYTGDHWGSFNAWMRLITGGLFGLGIVWFGFPYLDQVLQAQAQLNNTSRSIRLASTAFPD